jgi:Nucleotidyl transferase AbiEii toxin, Type IV TA system
VQTEIGLVLDLRELAADKLCALFGRAKSRDLYDVVPLSERLPLEQIVEWATEKDAGFDIGITKEMVVAIKPKLIGLDISPAKFDRIRTKLVVDLVRLEAKQRRLGSAPSQRSRDL